MDYEEVWSFGWNGFSETCASCEVNDWFIRRAGSQYNSQTWPFLLLVLPPCVFKNQTPMLCIVWWCTISRKNGIANRFLF